MRINKIQDIEDCRVDCVKNNQPGLYFLLNEKKELIYIGESKFPLIRILDHYHKHYQVERKMRSGKKQKGIGPVFKYFRIMNIKSTDTRIRQHFEKRWIRKFDPELNFNTRNVCYDLSWKEINGFIRVYEYFFKDKLTWYRYINDQVLRNRQSYIDWKKKQRKIRRELTGR